MLSMRNLSGFKSNLLTSGLALLLLGLACMLGVLIVWMATAPDDGQSIWPTWSSTGNKKTADGFERPFAEPEEQPETPFTPLVALNPQTQPQLIPAGRRALALADSVIGRACPEPGVAMSTLGLRFLPVAEYPDGRKTCLCVHELRISDYQAFMADSRYRMEGQLHDAWQEVGFSMAIQSAIWNAKGNGSNYPVSYISAEDAVAFCKWLTVTERQLGKLGKQERYRLPTDTEWSLAVGLKENQEVINPAHGAKSNRFPWGTEWPPVWSVGNLGLMIDGFSSTAPVMNFTESELGFHDMAGNVSEICTVGLGDYVWRGSNWASDSAVDCLSAAREPTYSNVRSRGRGLRLALELKPDS
jgi:hypothetical protein